MAEKNKVGHFDTLVRRTSRHVHEHTWHAAVGYLRRVKALYVEPFDKARHDEWTRGKRRYGRKPDIWLQRARERPVGLCHPTNPVGVVRTHASLSRVSVID